MPPNDDLSLRAAARPDHDADARPDRDADGRPAGAAGPARPSRRRFQAAAALLAGGTLAACSTPPGMPSRSQRAAARNDSADWMDQVRIEHRAVDAAFEKLLASNDPIERANLRDAVADALALHSIQEETVLYPRIALSGAAPTAQQLYADHAQVNVLLAELELLPKDHPAWATRVQNLRTIVQRHAQEEETQLYPQLRSKLPPEENRLLTVRYRQERARYNPT
jgi:hemerythrin superfamily protein